MSLRDLLDLVGILKTRVNNYRGELQRNETLTRYVLVDPLLRALGWDTENPELLVPEMTTQAGKPDYTLLHNGRKIAFVGVKALGKPEDLLQQISYCVSEGVRYFIATDGAKWEVYDTQIQKPLPEKRIAHWDINSMDAGEVVRQAFSTMRHAGVGMPPQSIEFKHHKPEGTPLTQITPKPHEKLKFTKIVFPDGRSFDLEYWRDLLVATVEWLSSTDKLKPPVKLPYGSTYIVNTEPKHANGHKFKSIRKVGDLFVETNFNNKDIVKHTKYLLQQHGVDAVNVFLHT
ncbi:MAG: hypothetical protein QXD61_11690 [Candidatus Caldarchaeum sp.]